MPANIMTPPPPQATLESAMFLPTQHTVYALSAICQKNCKPGFICKKYIFSNCTVPIPVDYANELHTGQDTRIADKHSAELL